MSNKNCYGGLLVCEDDASMVRIYDFMLRKVGIAPVHAVTMGKDVVAVARREKPALVLLDLMLPDMDGMAVLKELKSHPETREIPVIVVSAKESQQQIQAALQAGAADYVIKPFDPNDIWERLKSLISALSGQPTDTHPQAGA